MSLNDLTDRNAVLAAMSDYDELGRDEFLKTHGFARAQRYMVRGPSGRLYDSKAIAGVAYGKQFPDQGPLQAAEFSGGEATVVAAMERLGFEVVDQQSDVGRGQASLFGASSDPERTRPPAVWVEETHVKGIAEREAGPYALGVVLWSPQRATDGRDIYANMRDVQQGDIVFHLTDNEGISGVSVAAGSADTNFVGLAGSDWADRPAYKVPLTSFTPLSPPLSRDWFLGDPAFRDQLMEILKGPRGRGLFYNRKLELNQGAYLTLAPPSLVRLLSAAYHARTGESLPLLPDSLQDTAAPLVQQHRSQQIVGKIALPTQIWMWSPGEQAVYWDEFYANSIMGIGWEELGDLNQYDTLEDFKSALSKINNSDANPSVNARMCFDFAKNMRIGDIVLVKRGRRTIIGRGLIEGIYQYEPGRRSYPNIRSVRWTHRGQWRSPTLLPMKTLTDWTRSTETPAVEEMLGASDDTGSKTHVLDVSERKKFGIDDALDGMFMERPVFEDLLNRWRRKKNLVIQGAPGVGKSFVARRLAYALMGYEDPTRVKTVQFHQSYSYEDFVQGYRPTGGGFALRDGVFLKFCQLALEDPSQIYVFIIDEINRGNLSKILGELMLLIEVDKRSPNWAVKLAYAESEDERFYVPPNLFLLGMMNTADRSLAVVDYALRRRFAFATLLPAFGHPLFRQHLETAGVAPTIVDRIISKMTDLNEAIASDTSNLGPGFCVGHSFFVPPPELGSGGEEWYEEVAKGEIIPLLEEYWFDQPDKVSDWRQELLKSG